MLYPALDSLIEKIGNRYLLVNVTAKRAREIAQEAADEGIRLTDKPVRLAVVEIAEGKYVYNPTEEQKADLERLTAEEIKEAEEAIEEIADEEAEIDTADEEAAESEDAE
ncbi:MAG: DNA-directed RNA polymerase subunit omega [Oscillospiraceae bacterium]|nr:DNA-directed RNA polymerase subunit omega [Oscillospiraceae bacterium]